MNRRRKKLIRVDLQLKVVFITLFVASFCLLINFQLLLASLWGFSATLVTAGNYDRVLDSVRQLVIQKFLVALAISVPLAVSVSILYSFKFCGPIHRFKKHLTGLVEGEPWDRPCTLRDGDQLVDVCDAINGAIGQLRDRVGASHELLQQVDQLLREGGLDGDGLDDGRREQLAAIRRAIAEEAEVWASRTSGPAAATDTPVARPLAVTA